MNRYLLVLCTLMLAILSSCSKKEDEPTAAEDLRTGVWARPMTNNTYVFGKVMYKDPVTNGDSTRDYIPRDLLCHIDNSLEFKANGVGSLEYGVNRCSGSEAQNKTFTWEMNDDGSRLSMYGVGDFFGADNVEATVLLRSLGVLTIRYRQITIDPRFQTSDTLVYTDVIRRL